MDYLLTIARVLCSFLRIDKLSYIMNICKLTEVNQPLPADGEQAGGDPRPEQGRVHPRRHRTFVCRPLDALYIMLLFLFLLCSSFSCRLLAASIPKRKCVSSYVCYCFS